MLKPICVPCRQFYRPHRNGTYFVEAKPRGGALAPAGLAAPEMWEPYKVWLGDLWRCNGCGHEIIHGVAFQPVSQHYLPEFADTIEKTGADKITVNDC